MRKGFTFGYKKSLKPIDLTPGPADYGTNLLHEKPLVLMKLSNTARFEPKNKKYIILSPGPGSYDPKEISSIISLPLISKSLRNPHCFFNSKGIPGPGQYNIPSQIGSSNTYQKSHNKSKQNISNSPNFVHKLLTPGPGYYSINESFYKSNHSIKFLQGGSGKFKSPSFISDNGFPGPGNYMLRNKKTGPKFSFGQKYELNGNLIIQPGPDSYDVNLMNASGVGQKFFRNANYTFSKSLKGKDNLSEIRYLPGPGSYNVRKENPLLNENGIVFNTAIRPLYQSESFTPGPGSYVSLTSLIREKKIGYSQSCDIKNKRWKKKFKREKSYDSIEEEEKKQKEMRKQKFLLNLKEMEESQQYLMPKTTQTPKNSPQIALNFGQSLKILRRTNSDSEIRKRHAKFGQKGKEILLPFPKLPIMKTKKVSNTKSFSIGKSIRKLEYLDPGNVSPSIARSPGPAGYFLEAKLNKKTIKMSTSKRDDKFLVLNKNPGAGSYNFENMTSFAKKQKKKKKINGNLVKLLTRIQMKIHPEKLKRGETLKSLRMVSKNQKFAVLIKK